MFRALRIAVLLLVLLVVVLDSWRTSRSTTSWDRSIRVSVYPINADGATDTAQYIAALEPATFEPVERFFEREIGRFGHDLRAPVQVTLGREIGEQPPALGAEPSLPGVMLWSLKMRWWASGVTDDQDRIRPDVRIFVRYHGNRDTVRLEDSVGMRKGMYGIVNAYAGTRFAGSNNVIIAHELLHTLGATDKYDPATGQPLGPDGIAEPEREPLYPQRYAEIMGGRIAVSDADALVPKSLGYVMLGPLTAAEIGLTD